MFEPLLGPPVPQVVEVACRVKGTGPENQRACKGTVGSNPTLSAIEPSIVSKALHGPIDQ